MNDTNERYEKSLIRYRETKSYIIFRWIDGNCIWAAAAANKQNNPLLKYESKAQHTLQNQSRTKTETRPYQSDWFKNFSDAAYENNHHPRKVSDGRGVFLKAAPIEISRRINNATWTIHIQSYINIYMINKSMQV